MPKTSAIRRLTVNEPTTCLVVTADLVGTESRVNAFLGAVVGADIGTHTGDGVHRE
jgi:hypothetical protein